MGTREQKIKDEQFESGDYVECPHCGEMIEKSKFEG